MGKPGSSLLASSGGAPVLGATTEFRDPMHSGKWTCAQQSRDGEYVVGATSHKDQHVIRVWEARGAALAVVLEGSTVGLHTVSWLPDPSRCDCAPCDIDVQGPHR